MSLRPGMHRAILSKFLCTQKVVTPLQNTWKFETSGHIHNMKHLSCFRYKGPFTTAVATAVKPAADNKQQLACPAGPNEH